MKPKILVILGPTATGKSDLAVRLSKKFDGEVVSADSRQIYRGLDIGSGKITKREMQKVPHHMLDVAQPKTVYSVTRYTRDANSAVQKILKKKKVPIIVGGTGMYIDALVDGIIFPEVPPNPLLRKKLEKKSTEELYRLLKKKDSRRAKNIDRHNRRRLIRALEIAEKLGKTPTLHKNPLFTPLHIGLVLPSPELQKKIHTRLLARMKKGMVREVAKLRKEGLSWKRFAELGLEYRYLALYLQKMIQKKEMLERLETEILQYSKRQMTWFKRDARIHWFRPVKDVRNIEKLVKQFLTT